MDLLSCFIFEKEMRCEKIEKVYIIHLVIQKSLKIFIQKFYNFIFLLCSFYAGYHRKYSFGNVEHENSIGQKILKY